MNRALIENGVVVNVIIADASHTGSVAIPDDVPAGIGWLYDGQTFTAPPPPPARRKSYTVAQFIEALTRPEALAFLATMKTDPLLEMWYELAKARGVIDFNDTDTLTNAPYLVQAGVVTQSRLDELTG